MAGGWSVVVTSDTAISRHRDSGSGAATRSLAPVPILTSHTLHYTTANIFNHQPQIFFLKVLVRLPQAYKAQLQQGSTNITTFADGRC